MEFATRPEEPGDEDAVDRLTYEAFQKPDYAVIEHKILAGIRSSGCLTVSIVAVGVKENDKIIGHIAASPVTMPDGSKDWYGIGPVSVAPDCQRKGIGSAMVRDVIQELRKTVGAKGCVLLGSTKYYPRFGFKQVDGLWYPGGPPEDFMALRLRRVFGPDGEEEAMPQGPVYFCDAFENVNP